MYLIPISLDTHLEITPPPRDAPEKKYFSFLGTIQGSLYLSNCCM